MATVTDIPEVGREVPGPQGSFLLGNIREFRADPLTAMHDVWREYGDLARVEMLGRVFYIVSGPQFVYDIFVTGKRTFIKTYARPNNNGLELLLGNGLVTNFDHDHWLPQRRMMQPMFHSKRIMTMGDKMVAAGQAMLNRWAKLANGTTIDLHKEMMTITLDIINRTMFSTTDAINYADKVGSAITTTAEFVFQRNRAFIRPPLSWPTPKNKAFNNALDEIDNIIEMLIEQRRQSSATYADLLDMLLEARDEETGAGMSEQQLRDEVKTIYAAGHETTSNALSWVWYLLAQHPDVLAQLQAEVDAVLNGRIPTLADLPNLPYTTKVFKEGLRLYPAVPAIPRYVPEGAILQGYKITPKANVVFNTYNLHRHPEHWQKPEAFWPEHFTPEREEQRDQYAYRPFGAGPRICIGRNFAMMEGQLLLAMIAQNYTFNLIPDHPVKPEIAVTLRPKNGMMVKIEKRP